ncbi:DUF814 domain-containing protein [Desulfogranum japonicum]|uniref:DUF814 domain-containing protein n=1 Tax=Desulfogranum japonicum TaxID=231447 RepID=UPI000405570D|nr:DUF814 domain-containing protein [Desulfogranum japonicum]
MKDVIALGLFSGGLDSILACRTVAEQGIRVIGLKFVTPFFDNYLLGCKEKYQKEMQEKYELQVEVIDLSQGYLQLLHNPEHGFGKNFNPCIDCKIMMLRTARELMATYNASFLITGEVVGQRPMSQRRDTMRVIERDSGCSGLLLRPLSALLLPPTPMEEKGLVDRAGLHRFAGRGRKPQIELAARYGITDYPNPAGGCILTDRNLGARIKALYNGDIILSDEDLSVEDVRLLLVGRQFQIGGKYWLVVGRNERENELIRSLQKKGDWLLSMENHPGPTALLRSAEETVLPDERENVLQYAAGIVVRYAKKVAGVHVAAEVCVEKDDSMVCRSFEPLDEEVVSSWQIT